ncbi:MAG: hypothetical protein A2293_16790 [Elusimicrobia bacterium RIFOXYB2_FULL_49_7]|nr:MAG: hypothetical protein A2293_16790 [Elusimicrobia bacterium RIFOXYB2_FULL_49_7]
MLSILSTLIGKVFIYIIIGAALDRLFHERSEKAVKGFISFSFYVLIPVFAFTSLWTSPVSLTTSTGVLLVAAGVSAGGTLLAYVWTSVEKLPFREYCLPIIVMNSAYLAIPVNTMLWGKEGTNYSIVYSMVNTIMVSTFGIYMVSEKKTFLEILKVPVVYAVVLGSAFNLLQVSPLPALKSAAAFVSAVTLPAMLLFVGSRLGNFKKEMFSRVVMGVFLRMAGGFVMAVALTHVLGIGGTARGVCLMTSSMPAAVNAYIYSERYRSNPEFAAANVFLGTMIAFLMIVLVTYFKG